MKTPKLVVATITSLTLAITGVGVGNAEPINTTNIYSHDINDRLLGSSKIEKLVDNARNVLEIENPEEKVFPVNSDSQLSYTSPEGIAKLKFTPAILLLPP